MRMVWLQQRGLIASQKTCRKCDSDMRFGGKSGVTDGFVWRCKRKGCKTTVSPRDGSFFEKSKLPMSKLLHCIYLWALETSIVSATAQLAVSAPTLVDFYNFLREVCSTALIRNPVQLGGPGRIVQIDESLFAHKPKYHRGRAPQSEIWVFGMADCTSNPALGFMQIVDRRNAETLLPIIQRHILPGSIVYSDQWAAYNRVGNIAGLEHHTVNHTLHFVDPVTGVHTQNIESYWNRCKTKIKSMKGVRRHMLPGYLDEFMWRERAGADKFNEILNEIALQYRVNR